MSLYKCGVAGFGDKVRCLYCGESDAKQTNDYITVIGDVLDEFVIRYTTEYVCNKCGRLWVCHCGWFDRDTRYKKKKVKVK